MHVPKALRSYEHMRLALPCFDRTASVDLFEKMDGAAVSQEREEVLVSAVGSAYIVLGCVSKCFAVSRSTLQSDKLFDLGVKGANYRNGYFYFLLKDDYNTIVWGRLEEKSMHSHARLEVLLHLIAPQFLRLQMMRDQLLAISGRYVYWYSGASGPSQLVARV